MSRPPGIFARICSLLEDVPERTALTRYADVQRELRAGDGQSARADALGLAAFLIAMRDKGQMTNPNGGAPPTVEKALSGLLQDVLSSVGLGGTPIPPAALEDGFVGVVSGHDGGTAVAENGLYGASFPPGWSDKDALVVMEPLADDSDPLFTELQQVPAFVHISSTPDVAPFRQQVTVGLCAVTDGLSDPQIEALRVAHNVGETIEILDLVAPSFDLACDAPARNSPAALAGGKDGRDGAAGPRLAATRTIGGQISSFSPFGGVVAQAPGAAPKVNFVQFPDTIPNDPGSGSDNVGTVGFADPDGDITRIFFVVVSGAATGGDFDPGVRGQREGTFNFVFGCFAPTPCAPGPITLGVILEDAAGNVSDQVDFSFFVEDTAGERTGRVTPVGNGRPTVRRPTR